MQVPKYSVYGSDSFHNYIQKVLWEICERFLEVIPSHKVKALVLGGGYGRSEGGVLLQDGQEKLYNDLDFFVFTNALPFWQKRSVNQKLSTLHQELSEHYGIDIDFAKAKNASSLTHEDISLMYYDLSCAHKVIYGNAHILSYLPAWKPEDLPQDEALRMLMNRGMGLFFAREYLSQEDYHRNLDFILRNIHKAYQGILDAILIFERKYHHSNLQRLKDLVDLDLSQYTDQPSLKELISSAMAFKLKPELHDPGWEALQAEFAQAIQIYRDIYYALWARYFGEKSLSYSQYLQRLTQISTSRKAMRIKNLGYTLRDLPPQAILSKAAFSHPRLRLYMALPHLLFEDKIDNIRLQTILSLPEHYDLEMLRYSFVKLWQAYN